MFDVGFSELLLVLTLGLIILGPKRLPVAIRTVMGWVNTIRQMATNVQNELSQELKLQELQESLKKVENLNVERLSPELAETVKDLKASAEKMREELEKTGTTQKEEKLSTVEKVTEEKDIPIFSPKTAHSQPFSPAPMTPVPTPAEDRTEESPQEKTKEEKNSLQMNPDYYPEDDLAGYDYDEPQLKNTKPKDTP